MEQRLRKGSCRTNRRHEIKKFITQKFIIMNVLAKYPAHPATKPIFGGLLDEIFNRNIGDFIGSDGASGFTPAVNVLETKDDFRLEVAAPGFAKENFSVHVNGDHLTIGAEKESKTDDTQERFTRREFHFTSFKRSFRLPQTVNQNAIAAVYENGILKVTVPKKEEAKPVVRTVEIA